MKAHKRKHIENTKKSGTHIEVIKMANYEAPEIIEQYGTNYVTYGPYNSYYTYLQERFYGSPTNSAIITSIGQQIYGKGLAATNEDSDMIGWARLMELLKPKDLRLVCLDYKLHGQAALQLGVSKGVIIKAIHQPIETLAKGKKNDMGEVESYYYSADFSNITKYPAKKIQAFGYGKSRNQILYIGGYTPGLMYYSKVDYQAGLQSAETEEEMSNFHLSNVKSGFSPSIMVNFNNGDPGEKIRHKIKSDILKEWTGSGGSKVFLSFNDDAQNGVTIDAVPIQKPHDQYQFLSTETQNKILVSHRVTSPLMIGIKDAAGFSSNAEELKVSFQLWNATVIRPFQDVILDALQEIILFNKWNFDIYFENLQPIEFTEDGIDSTTDKEEVEKETGVEMSRDDLDASELDIVLDYFAEDAPNGYIIHEVEDVGDEPEDLDYEILYNSMQKELSGVGVKSAPISKSSLDSPLYKVRYRYKKVRSPKGDSRSFCKKVHSLSGQNKFFRKEDINFMSFKGVNNEFGHNKQNYSIWLFKGGVNCYDIWERVIFKKELQENGKPFIGNPLQNIDKKVKKAPGVKAVNKTVKTAPIDMPGQGRYPGTF